MRILYSLPAVCVSGGVIHFLQVAARLKERGHEVVVRAPLINDLESLPNAARSVTIEPYQGLTSNLYTLPSERHPLQFLRGLCDLTVGVRKMAQQIPEGTELIHAGFHPNAAAAVLARRKGWWNGAIVQAVHMDPQTFLPISYRRRYGWWFRNTVRQVDHLLTVSPELVDNLKRYDLPITEVGNAVDPAFLDTPLAARPRNLGNLILYYCGAISARKGIDVLLKGFQGLLEECPGAQLLISGRGSWDSYYRSVAEQLGILSRVEYLGVVSVAQQINLMDRCDMFVFPSYSEGFGLPPLEAMARECAVVVAENEGTRQYIQHQKNCWVIPPGDSEQLTRALKALADKPELCARLGAAGRQTALEYSWEQVTDRTEQAFQQTLESRRTDRSPD